MMTHYLDLLISEWLKLRRTPVPVLVAAAPWLVTGFFALFAFHDGRRFLHSDGAWAWLSDSSFTFFSLIVLPLWTAIVTAQVAAVEHGARAFDHLFTLPVRRLNLYLAKQALCWLLAAAGFFGLALSVVFAGWLLRLLRPGLGFEQPVPFGNLLGLATAGFLASLFLVALHTWIALQRTDMATPIAAGFLATVSMLALSSLDASLTPFHPWAYPAELVGSWVAGETQLVWPMVGAVGGGLFACFAGSEFVRRDVL